LFWWAGVLCVENFVLLLFVLCDVSAMLFLVCALLQIFVYTPLFKGGNMALALVKKL